MRSTRLSPSDPGVVAATSGLIALLRDMVRSVRKPVRDCGSYLEVFWLTDMPGGALRSDPHRDEVLLVVDHVPMLAPPPLPGVLEGWVDPARIREAGPDDPPLAERGPAQVWVRDEYDLPVLAREVVDRSEATTVLDAYTEWVAEWRAWSRQELTAQPRRALYERLAKAARLLSQHDDTYEAVLAVGLLSSTAPETGRVHRHLLTVRVVVSIDRTSARLQASLAVDQPPRWEDRDFLELADGYMSDRAEPLRAETERVAPHPLSEEAATLLTRWSELALNRPVRCEPTWRPSGATTGEVAEVTVSPAIILRERDRNGLVEYYDRIAAELSGVDATSPLGLSQVLFPLEPEERLRWPSGSTRRPVAELSDDPLFPKPTNPAQRAVLDQLRTDTAVVVQGPPGTGKTHTIANLICALLASGQRILVTSQKDQALRVLRDQLPGAVRDLCVLMTGLQRGGPNELERSITALSDRVTTTDPARLQSSIDDLHIQRNELRSRYAALTNELHMVREAEFAEYLPIADGYGGKLATIVDTVNIGRVRYEWIQPMPPQAPVAPPVSIAEVVELRGLLLGATLQRRARAAQQLPDLRALPSIEEFETIVKDAREGERDSHCRQDPAERALASLGTDALAAVIRHVAAASEAQSQRGLPGTLAEWDPADWRTGALADWLGRRNAALWQQVADLHTTIGERQQALAEIDLHQVHTPQLAQDELALMIEVGERLHEFLADGGRLRRRFPTKAQKQARPLLKACTVNTRTPIDAADIAAVLTVLRAELVAKVAVHRWAQVEVAVDDNELSVRLSQLADLHEELDVVAAIRTARDCTEDLLRQQGIDYRLFDAAGWDSISRAARLAPSLARAQHAVGWLGSLQTEIERLHQASDGPPELEQVSHAIQTRDANAYRRSLRALQEAHGEQREQQRCTELHDRLRVAHPLLAERLADTLGDPAWDQRLTDLAAAWDWGRAADFCQRMRIPGRDQQLQRDLDEVEQRLSRLTAELAGQQALLHCLTRMTQSQRQALQAYRAHMSAYGKGTGRYKARYQRAARDAMMEARQAVPAWVMPLSHVVDTINPDPDTFDVVIVDEASQVGIEALFLLWLAPRVVIVGDDKQCAPAQTAFGELQAVFDRIDTYLPDVRPAVRDGFTPRTNLYELLSMHFPKIVRLTEHFRCMPEIINWSSKQFYDGRLIPLRQFGADRLEPLKVVRVEGAYEEGRDTLVRNPVEAKMIVEQLQAITRDPAYAGRSIGVIALQGTGQVRLIENEALKAIDIADWEKFQLQVGAPPDFQGTERDVILLSMVVTKARRMLALPVEQRRFNVAASRARDQMWLFTSVAEDQLRRGDLRYSLLNYMTNPPSALLSMDDLADVTPDEPHPRFDSIFEQRVFLRLRDRGYAVIPQYPVETRRIDLVVVGAQGRLAVECDGHAFHTTLEKRRDDLERERELRRAGWQFFRVRDSEFRFDPDGALAELWQMLERRGIRPCQLPPSTTLRIDDWQPVTLPNSDDRADGTDEDE
ncbi:MAG: AAA domain-containing protein [Pseudonocardiaceae bacterium]